MSERPFLRINLKSILVSGLAPVVLILIYEVFPNLGEFDLNGLVSYVFGIIVGLILAGVRK